MTVPSTSCSRAARVRSASHSWALVEPLEARWMLADATLLYVISPGEESAFPNWAYDMAAAISNRNKLGCTEAQITNSRVAHNATDLTPAGACPHFLLFDWTGAGATAGAANDEAVAGKLVQAIRERVPAEGQLDVHFIGHGRGAYVISEAARRLTNDEKVGFVQVTALDPVFRGDDGLLASTLDADWVERLYQTADLPTGATRGAEVLGGVNINLTTPLSGWNGRSASPASHQEVRDWYHWTIDTDDVTPFTYRDAVLNTQQRTLEREAATLVTRKALYEALKLDLDLDGKADFVDAGKKVGFHWSRSQAFSRQPIDRYTGLDLVIAIDASGSMVDDLEELKKSAIQIVQQIGKCHNDNLRIGLVVYEWETYTVLPMTSDLDTIVAAIRDAQLPGGGIENAYTAIDHVLLMKDGLGSWRGGSIRRAILLMTDEPPQEPEFDPAFTRHSATIRAFGTQPGAVPTDLFAVVVDTSWDGPAAKAHYSSLTDAARGAMVVASGAEEVAEAIIAAACGGESLPIPEIQVEGISRPYREGSQVQPRAVRFTIKLSFALTEPLDVSYWTVDGTAKAGRDYVGTKGKVTFAPGVTEKTIVVRLIGDWHREREEQFVLRTSAIYQEVPLTAQRQARIADDDARAGDLAYDDQGNLHQVYAVLKRIHYRMRSPDGTWSDSQRIDRRKGVYDYVSLAMTPSGAPAVAYYDAYRSLLKYAVLESGQWLPKVVDGTGNAGRYCALAFDAAGRANIAYYDKVSRDLRLAVLRDGRWNLRTLLRRGNVGQEVDLAQHPRTGRLALAYVDRAREALIYGEQTRLGWNYQIVHELDRRVGDLSLAFNPATRQPTLSYHDAGRKDLLLARFDGRKWRRERVARTGNVGSENHLFFDGDGVPQILYYNSSAKGIFLARRGSDAWQLEKVASGAGALLGAAGGTDGAEDFLWLVAPTEQLLVDLLR